MENWMYSFNSFNLDTRCALPAFSARAPFRKEAGLDVWEKRKSCCLFR
jgi:hypothetical protein